MPVWGNAVGAGNDAKKKSKAEKKMASVRVNERQSKKAGGEDAPMLKQTHVTFASESESDEEYEDLPTGVPPAPAPAPPISICKRTPR